MYVCMYEHRWSWSYSAENLSSLHRYCNSAKSRVHRKLDGSLLSIQDRLESKMNLCMYDMGYVLYVCMNICMYAHLSYRLGRIPKRVVWECTSVSYSHRTKHPRRSSCRLQTIHRWDTAIHNYIHTYMVRIVYTWVRLDIIRMSEAKDSMSASFTLTTEGGWGSLNDDGPDSGNVCM